MAIKELSKSPYDNIKMMVMNSHKQLTDLIPEAAKADLSTSLLLDQIHHQFKYAKNADKLQQCTPESIAGVIKHCCQLGLELGWGSGTPDIYLIPYSKDCQMQMSYTGELKLARRSGLLKSAYSDIIYSGDEFEAWNDMDGQHFKHKKTGWQNQSPENIQAVYAVAVTNDGTPYLEVMTKDAIDLLEAKTRKGSNQSPAWRDWWDQMARKTVLRRVLKKLPQGKEQPLAESIDNQASVIEVQTSDKGNVKQLTAKEMV